MGKFLADITPLRESPAFRRLWLGSAVSALGSQLTLVAVSLEVYRLTQDSLYVGLLSIFALVPLVFGGLLGGSIADAHDRRTVALLASSVLWLTTAALALQAWLELGNVWLLYALVAVQSGAQAINQPARSAIIPVLVRKELLPAANALSMMIFGLTMTAGPLLAGVLVAWMGFGWTYTIDVVSFAFAFWALLKLPPMPPGRARQAGRAAFRGGGIPLPWHPAQPPHDVRDRPRGHDLCPAPGAAARHRRADDRRRRGHGGRSCWPRWPWGRSWPACSRGRWAASAGRAPPSCGP